MNLCIDCRWFQKSLGSAPQHATCGHPSTIGKPEISPVTGEPGEPYPVACSTHRLQHISDDPCGPDGKYWEAAEPRGFA
jgi:hypothetical protein